MKKGKIIQFKGFDRKIRLTKNFNHH